jgi:hypothetical protein
MPIWDGETMRLRFSLAICLGCLCVTYLQQDARATPCGPPEELPRFAESLNPNSTPKPPADCAGLGLYGADLEIFRNNTVERYNKKLIAFGSALTKADENYRNALKNGKCTAAQYEALKEGVRAEFDKIASEYLEPYNEIIFAYKEYAKVLIIKKAQCALASYKPQGTRLTSIFDPR